MHLAGRTDVGLIREHNEDGFLFVDLALGGDGGGPATPPASVAELVLPAPVEVGERGALLLVCDGMGGAAAGEVASSMALETMSSLMLQPTQLPPATASSEGRKVHFARRMREATFQANRRIHEASRSDELRAGMGTTMTAVGVVGQDLVMAQVGDSRAYVLRQGALTQVTRDQSLVNQLLETGQITEEQARLFEHSNVILQALGVQDDVEVLLSTVSLRRGDRIVVCTDGLTGVVSDEELTAVLGSTPDMNEVCRLLIEMARAAGGPDNITVLAARFDGNGLPPPAAQDVIAYERWWLDEPQPQQPRISLPSEALDSMQRTPARRASIDPARTFLSLMLLLALALGGLVLGAQLHQSSSAVHCVVSAAAGLAIRVDGRDVGQRTRSDETPLRLPPGQHRIGLRGPGAPNDERAVDVASGGECKVSFRVTP